MSQRTFTFVILLCVWLIAAAGIGRLGGFRAVPRPALQVLLVALTALLLITYTQWTAFRAFVQGLPIRLLIGLHVTRFIGFYFLYLHAKGQLPYAFAVPGGWGDIGIAALALGICCLPLHHPVGRRVALIWNTLGLIDILAVVATAAVLGLHDPASMIALTIPPLCLLPAFLVPLLIASHLVLFERLLSSANRADAPPYDSGQTSKKDQA